MAEGFLSLPSPQPQGALSGFSLQFEPSHTVLSCPQLSRGTGETQLAPVCVCERERERDWLTQALTVSPERFFKELGLFLPKWKPQERSKAALKYQGLLTVPDMVSRHLIESPGMCRTVAWKRDYSGP